MKSENSVANSEVEIGYLLNLVWINKYLILFITMIFLAIGLVAHYLVPRVYESNVYVRPLLQTQYVGYQALSQTDVFTYNRGDLLDEYIGYVRDFDRLIASARDSGVVAQLDKSDAEYQAALTKFISGIDIEFPNPTNTEAEALVHIRARGNNQETLTKFVQSALETSRREMAEDLIIEVRHSLDMLKETQRQKMKSISVEIESRRKYQRDVIQDRIKKLSEQASIARTIGVEKPLEVRAFDDVQNGVSAPVEINIGTAQESYLHGYLALEKERDLLAAHENDDAFVDELRDLQRQLYLLENDPNPQYISDLIERSPLADTSTAIFSRYSLNSAYAEKYFPRFYIFLVGSILGGLIVGFVLVGIREVMKTKNP